MPKYRLGGIMNRKCFLIFKAMIVLLFSVSSCKTIEFGTERIDINGMIYDFSNRPVPNCEITLDEKYRSCTDINGRFSLPGIPADAYTITGYKNGYELYLEEIEIRDRGQIIYIRIPSQGQLNSLVDEALSANNLVMAEELAERAYKIDNRNIETLFYCAVIKFRRNDIDAAITLLENAKNLGSRDIYIEKFLNMLTEAKNAE